MTASDRKLILDLATGAISKAEFLSAYPVDIGDDRKHVQDLLCDAINRQDVDGVEYALLLGFSFGFPADSTDLLCSLLDAEWHQKHEDIARILQELRDPVSVDALFRAATARHQYLEYNDSTALAIKCVWALSKIGTQAALDRLKLIAETDERKEVRGTAMERLSEL